MKHLGQIASFLALAIVCLLAYTHFSKAEGQPDISCKRVLMEDYQHKGDIPLEIVIWDLHNRLKVLEEELEKRRR